MATRPTTAYRNGHHGLLANLEGCARKNMYSKLACTASGKRLKIGEGGQSSERKGRITVPNRPSNKARVAQAIPRNPLARRLAHGPPALRCRAEVEA